MRANIGLSAMVCSSSYVATTCGVSPRPGRAGAGKRKGTGEGDAASMAASFLPRERHEHPARGRDAADGTWRGAARGTACSCPRPTSSGGDGLRVARKPGGLAAITLPYVYERFRSIAYE